MRAIDKLISACATAAIVGCAGALPAQAPRTPRRIVPVASPDSIPAWVFADSNAVADSAQTAAIFYANVIEVRFMRGTSQADRQLAIDAVDGEVVGGSPPLGPGFEGRYLVRINAGRQIDPLRAAARKLRAMKQVSVAAPVYRAAEKDQRP